MDSNKSKIVNLTPIEAREKAVKRIKDFKNAVEKLGGGARNEREEEEAKEQNALNSALRKALHLSALHRSPSSKQSYLESNDTILQATAKEIILQQGDGVVDNSVDNYENRLSSSTSIEIERINLDDVRARADVLSEVVRGFRVMEAQSSNGLSIMADFKRGFSAAARHAAEHDRDAFESLTSTLREREKRIVALEADVNLYRQRADEGDSAKNRVRMLEEQLAFTNADASKRIAAAERFKERVHVAENALIDERRVMEDRLLIARRSFEISLVEATASLQARCTLQEQMVQQMKQPSSPGSPHDQYEYGTLGSVSGEASVVNFKSIQASSAVFRNLQETVELAVAEAVANKISTTYMSSSSGAASIPIPSSYLPSTSSMSVVSTAEVDRLNDEIDALRQELLDSRAESSMLESTNSLLRATVSKTETAIAEAESLRVSLNEAKNDHTNAITALEEIQRQHAMLTKSLLKLRAVEIQLATAQTQTGLTEQIVKEKDKEILRLTNEITSLHKTYEEQLLIRIQEKATLCDQLTRLEGEAMIAKEIIIKQKSELTRISADEKTIQTQAERLSKLLESEEETTSLTVHGLQSELEKTKALLQEALLLIKTLEAQILIEKTAKSRALSDSAEHKIVAEKCMLELEAAQFDVKNATLAKESAQEETRKLHIELEDALKDLSDHAERSAEILNEEEIAKTRLEGENATYTATVIELNKTIDNLKRQNEDLEGQGITMKTLMDTISQELEDLEKEKDALYIERNALRKEREILLLQHENDIESVADVVNLREESENFEIARNRLRGIIESRDLTISQLEEDVQSLKKETSSLKQELDETTAMKKTLLSGVGNEAQKLVQLQAKLLAKEKELKESQDETDQLVTELLMQKSKLLAENENLITENEMLKKQRKK
jgi:hypothetical protein